jgi:ABC-type Co2+ transport system permease subunit
MAIFAVTQIPLALAEGFLTVLIMRALKVYAPDDLQTLNAETERTVAL